jgi:putative sterol carrier protein
LLQTAILLYAAQPKVYICCLLYLSMKHFVLIFLGFFCCKQSFAQNSYWQQQINYNIQATLNIKDKIVEGNEKINYTNNSPDTLQHIWLHVWMNAYKSDKSAFSESLLQNRKTKFYFSDEEERGGITKLDFEVNDIKAKFIYDSQHLDIIKLILPNPLLPKQSIVIETPFTCKLPYNFYNGGYIENDFHIANWYIKPAVYDKQGWHKMPYTQQGSLYSPFANFEVNITLPENYLIASSGILQQNEEFIKLKQLGKLPTEKQPNFNNKETKEAEKEFFLSAKSKKSIVVKENIKTKTLTYLLNNAKDFVWMASPNFLVKYDTLQTDKKTIDCYSFFMKSKSELNRDNMSIVKKSFHLFNKYFPTNTIDQLTVVAGYKKAAEQATYTALVYVNEDDSIQHKKEIANGIGLQFTQEQLGVNATQHQWLSSGLAEHLVNNSLSFKSATNNKVYDLMEFNQNNDIDLLNVLLNKINKNLPIDTTNEAFNNFYFNLKTNDLAVIWFNELKKQVGEENFAKAIKNYFATWQNKHPTPNDFKDIVASISNKEITTFFNKLHNKQPIINPITKTLKPNIFLPFFSNNHDYQKHTYINIAPMATYNYYDGVRPGLLVHNYQPTMPKLQYALNPSFGTSSNNFNFFGRLAYNVYKKSYWLELSTSYQNYSYNNFRAVDNNGQVEFNKHLTLSRFVPHAKLTFYNNDVNSTARTVIGFKTFYLQQQNLSYSSKTNNYIFSTKLYVNRLYLNKFDNRVLYPYHLQLVADQTKDLLRLSLTAKQFFNYAKYNGGIAARFFAGKIFYWQPKNISTQFQNYNYWFNLLGTTGEDDYTFSDYFVGRNELQRGWKGQQIMERDGYFKMRMDYTAPVGRTDDWLMAANFNIDMPDYPMFKLYADVGTFAEAWKENPATGRFLYTAGIQLSLFNNVVNIYAPLFNSSVFNDHNNLYLTNNKFAQSVSFSINLQNIHFNKLISNIPL